MKEDPQLPACPLKSSSTSHIYRTEYAFQCRTIWTYISMVPGEHTWFLVRRFVRYPVFSMGMWDNLKPLPGQEIFLPRRHYPNRPGIPTASIPPRYQQLEQHTDRFPIFNPLTLVILPVPKPFSCHYKCSRFRDRGWCGQPSNWINVREHGLEVDIQSWKTKGKWRKKGTAEFTTEYGYWI